jgi:hypothetical protein
MKSIRFSVPFASSLIAVTLANAAPAPLARLMVEEINPAANILWSAGVKDTLSEKDWGDIRQAVAKLSTASVTIAEGGTMPGERDRAKSPEWKDWSQKFTAVLRAAKRASDGRDRQALIMAGNSLVDVCEGCHIVVAAPPDGRR